MDLIMGENMPKAKFVYNDVEYTLDQGLGIYLSSSERVKSGTIREIYDRLFYAIPYCGVTDWRLVVGQDTSLETFKKKIAQNQMVDGEFRLWCSSIDSNRKASLGDVIEFHGHLFKCVQCWTNIWFFSYYSDWQPITKNNEFREKCDVMDSIKAKLLEVKDGQSPV